MNSLWDDLNFNPKKCCMTCKHARYACTWCYYFTTDISSPKNVCTEWVDKEMKFKKKSKRKK